MPSPDRPVVRSRPVTSGLGGAFRGAVVPAGRRLGSFSIDAAVVLLLSATAAVLTRSVALTSIVILEAAVALAVWEARTGLTVGHAALGLRTACDDRPWSPGAARELVRAGVVGAGALAGGVGAWVVVASGGLDRTGRGRTWADRAGRTVVVRVADVTQRAGDRPGDPPGLVRQRPGPGPAVSGPAVSGPAVPTRMPGPTATGPVLPGPAGPRPRRLMVGGPAAPAGSPPVGPRLVPSPAVRRPAVPREAPGSPSTPTPAPPPVVPRSAGSAAAPSPQPDVTVLLVLDTGQRDQLPFGTAAVLGRDPAPQVASDRTVVVHDGDGVSKSHLRVEHTADGVWLTDLGSTNGTFLLVDGPAVPLAPRIRTRIDGVVRVAVGHRVLMVSYMVRGGRP